MQTLSAPTVHPHPATRLVLQSRPSALDVGLSQSRQLLKLLNGGTLIKLLSEFGLDNSGEFPQSHS